MKTAIVAFSVVALLAFSAVAFAGGGHYGGPGMMGYYGGGPGMMGYYGNGPAVNKETQAFLDKTASLRKELNEKRFEYMEAVRSGDETKAESLAKQIDELGDKIFSQAPRTAYAFNGGYCW